MVRKCPNHYGTRLGHFRIKVRKCSVDTSEVLFGGVHRTLPNLYSEVSYATTFLFSPVSCRFHWLISSFSCSQMILHIFLITVCTYFEPGRPWADIIQEINKKSKNSNFLLFTKWLPDLDWLTAWITLGIGQRGHFRIKVQKCPEPLPRAGNSTSNWAVQNARLNVWDFPASIPSAGPWVSISFFFQFQFHQVICKDNPRTGFISDQIPLVVLFGRKLWLIYKQLLVLKSRDYQTAHKESADLTLCHISHISQ